MLEKSGPDKTPNLDTFHEMDSAAMTTPNLLFKKQNSTSDDRLLPKI